MGGFLSSLNKTAVNRGFPVFVAPVRDGFGASNAAVSLIFSLARAESGPTGPMAGWFIDRFGPRLALFVGALMSDLLTASAGRVGSRSRRGAWLRPTKRGSVVSLARLVSVHEH